jgi:uncharacterized protein YjeT (DUF2065 family)
VLKLQISNWRGKLTGRTDSKRKARTVQEGFLSAVAVGFVFILIGIIYITTQGLWSSMVNFFSNITTTVVPNTGIHLPLPANPNAHTVFYEALFRFAVGIGILQIIFFPLKIALRSPVSRAAETFGNLVFWFGAAYLVYTYLNETTTVNSWFIFWAGILIFSGLSLIGRAVIVLVRRAMR